MSERVFQQDYQDGGFRTWIARDEAGRPEKYFNQHNPLQPGDGCPICLAGLIKETNNGLKCNNCGRTAEQIQSEMGGEQWDPSH